MERLKSHLAGLRADGALPQDALAGLNIQRHQEEVELLWAHRQAGIATRTPMLLQTDARYFLAQKLANPQGITPESFLSDPSVMFESQLLFERWSRFNLLQDRPLGLPETWEISVDFLPLLDVRLWSSSPEIQIAPPETWLQRGAPDPFGALMGRAWEFYEFSQQLARQETFLGRPITILPPSWTRQCMGVLSQACHLCGEDMVTQLLHNQPERLIPFLELLTTSTIKRMEAWRQRCGLPPNDGGLTLEGDTMGAISVETYRRAILPCHQRFYSALAGSGTRVMRLLTDASRHLPSLHSELGLTNFDLVFGADFGLLRERLGEEVLLQGGPQLEFLATATTRQVRTAVLRILCSGVTAGGRFILREGNTLHPATPLENLEAMYHTAREVGANQNVCLDPLSWNHAGF